MIVVGILILLLSASIGTFVYPSRYRTRLIDISVSPDNVYEVKFQSVGEPHWPFGTSPGRLALLDEKREITKVNFEILNDGGNLSENNWETTWFNNRVEVLLYGEEQSDVLWIIYFNGDIETEHPNTRYGKEIVYPIEDSTDENAEPELDLYMFQVEEGYLSIYNALYKESFADFELVYGAKDNSARCILYETESTVHYLSYDRESKNEKCGLYVSYQATKDEDGSWGYENATIDNIYAYVYETGEVISSEKKSWQDKSIELYQEATGEY